jgi:hypothetical protein
VADAVAGEPAFCSSLVPSSFLEPNQPITADAARVRSDSLPVRASPLASYPRQRRRRFRGGRQAELTLQGVRDQEHSVRDRDEVARRRGRRAMTEKEGGSERRAERKSKRADAARCCARQRGSCTLREPRRGVLACTLSTAARDEPRSCIPSPSSLPRASERAGWSDGTDSERMCACGGGYCTLKFACKVLHCGW